MKRREADRSVGAALASAVLCLVLTSGAGGGLWAQPVSEGPIPRTDPATDPRNPADPGADDTEARQDESPGGEFVRFDSSEPPRAELTQIIGSFLNPAPGSRFAAYFIGSVEWTCRLSGKAARLQADLLVAYADLEDVIEEAEENSDGAVEGAASADSGVASDSGEAGEDGAEHTGDIMTIGPYRFRKYTVYAEGRVRIEFVNSPSHLEADTFFFEHPSGLALARNARLTTTIAHAQTVQTAIQSKRVGPGTSPLVDPANPFVRTPIVIRADVLRMYAFRHFNGEGVTISNSLHPVPPLALESASIDVFPVDMPPSEVERVKTLTLEELEAEGRKELERRRKEHTEERSRQERATDGATDGARDDGGSPERDAGLIAGEHFVIDPESTWFDILGQPIVPVPIARWDTRWNYFLPVHSIQYGSSSGFGPFVDANWNLNYLLNLFPFRDTAVMRELDRTARMGFETAYFHKRGFGFGPNVIYGASPRPWQNWRPEKGQWTFHGESRYFRLDDQGDDDRTTRQPIPTDNRYWGSVLHRQSIPYLGILDIEYSQLSDDAFLGEFFEEVEKEEKRQESLFYLRRTFDDNLALTGLYKYQTNDFEPTIERLPEGKGFVLQQPVFGTGFYTDAQASASNIRLQPGDGTTIPEERRYDRYDLFNQWSYPVSVLDPYVVFRPFSYARYTYYGEIDDPDEGSEDRLTLAAGVSASQQWTRVFDFDKDSFASRVLNIPQLKHLIVPQVTYLNAYSSDLDSEDVILTDDVDTVDLEESITLSLRNDFLTRRPIPGQPVWRQAMLSDRDVQLESVQYETARVFESNIAFVLYPQPHRDNNGDRSSVVRLDNSVWLNRLRLRGWFELDPNRDFHMDRMDASARFAFIPDRLVFTIGDRFTRTRTSTFYTDLRFWATPKWSFDGYWSHDFQSGRDVEWSVGVTRVFDRFAVSLEFVEDVGEDRDQTFLFTVSPIELFREKTFRR